MFEIGFSELALVFIIALVVLGPARLPKVARNLGQWAGRARSYLRHFTAELEREVQAHEAREQLESIKKLVQESAAGMPTMMELQKLDAQNRDAPVKIEPAPQATPQLELLNSEPAKPEFIKAVAVKITKETPESPKEPTRSE